MENIKKTIDQPIPVVPVNTTEKKSSPIILISSIIVFLLATGGLAYYGLKFFLAKKSELKVEEKQTTEDELLKPKTAVASQFATYQEVGVNVSPKVKDYQVQKGLTNIINKADFTFSAAAKNLLEKNSFVVVPSSYSEFYSLYESNRYSQIPNFVTTDSILHNYHLMFDYLLKKLEEEKLAAVLKSLNSLMLKESLSQYEALKGTGWENAAKRNVGFFSVGSKLMDSSVTITDDVKNEVGKELDYIAKHEGIEISPVMNLGGSANPVEALKEDYSQYIPRGHYDKNDLLKAYFKTMMWYGRLTFRFKNEDEIKSATLITLLLNKEENQKQWNTLYEPINFFVGKSDDINYYQFKSVLSDAYGNIANINEMASDKNKFATLVTLSKKLDPPQINSMPIFQASINADREKEIKGFRFMGQRFTIDASIFQRLITREVGPKGESCSKAPFDSGRMLPKALDISAAMGSEEALNILKGDGETKYACYPENMEKMKTHISGLKTDMWTQNLYWGWLYSLLPLTTKKADGYPSFMKNLAWLRKELNTYLGSFTELKHDTILYAKQVYAELGGGGEPEKKDDRGYVEPNPYVYARLASLLKMTKEGLEIRGLLSAQNKDNLEKMEQLAMSLKTISEKELNEQSLTDKEYELIRSYGGQLEHFWLEVNKEEEQFKQLGQRDFLDQNPAALVADIATDPNGQVLEEGTGYISEIYVVIPVDGKLRIAEGGVYSYYEFPWPMSDRLTDKKWRELVNSEKAPKLPEWTDVFIAPLR